GDSDAGGGPLPATANDQAIEEDRDVFGHLDAADVSEPGGGAAPVARVGGNEMKTIRCGMLLLGLCVLLPVGVRADEPGKEWVEPMRKVHARFKGTPGPFAHFGDSITVTMAFWAPLTQPPQKMDEATAKDYELVKKYLKPECWNKWKGPAYGNDGGMTIRWAHDNLDKWLKKHNPETVLIMFGTNDLTQFGPKEYEQKTRAVVRRCLDN